ncbi:MAG: hypothetical protein O7F11_01405 [Acidobacteria bacterium]|nr:hypothetical protein [Acidobacteriota bacterium]
MKRPPSGAAAARLAFPILAATLAAFGGLLTGGVLYFRDISLLHRPVRQVIRAIWHSGQLPLMDPAMDGGRHLLANPNYRVLHPTALLDCFLSLDQAYDAATVLQVFLAGWGLALLLRRQGASLAAARLGGLAFALSGPLLSLGNLPNLLGGVAWVPWILLAGLAARARPLTGLPVASLLAAVPLLAGGIESWGAAMVILAISALLSTHRSRGLLAVGAMAVGSILLAAVQILPALSLLRGSERGLGFRASQIFYWSLEPARFLEMLVPGLWGQPTDPARWWGGARFDSGVPLILSAYLGATVLSLAIPGLLALRPRRRSNRTPAGSVDAPSLGLRHLLIASGVAGAGLLFLALGQYNPLLSMSRDLPLAGALLRYPERLLSLVALPVAVAAAVGWESLTRAGGTRRILRDAWPGLLVVAALLAGVILYTFSGRVPLAPELAAAGRSTAAVALRGTAGIALAGVILLGACLWMAGRKGTRHLAGACAAGVVALDLLVAGVGINPAAEREILEEVPAAAAHIRAREGAGATPRLLRLAEPQVPGESIPPGVEVAWSRRSLAYRIPEEFGLALSLQSDVDRSAPLGNFFLRMAYEKEAGAARERVADRAAAAWEVSFADGPASVPAAADWAAAVFPRAPVLVLSRRPAAAPRLAVVPRATYLGDLQTRGVMSDLLEKLADPSLDPRVDVFITAPTGASVVGNWPAGEGDVTIRSDTPVGLLLDVELPGPGLLVVRDTFTAGWQLEVNGNPRQIVRTDLAWRGVVLTKGRHQVHFIYRQPGLLPGAFLSGTGLVLMVGLAAAGARHRRRAAVQVVTV